MRQAVWGTLCAMMTALANALGGTPYGARRERRALKEYWEKKALFSRMDEVVASLQIGVCICEMRDRAYPRFLSDQAARILGCEPQDARRRIRAGRPVGDALFGALTKEDMPALRPFVRDLEIVRDDGSEAWIRVQGSMQNRSGKALCYAVLTDITQSVRAARRQRWQDERFLIVNAMTHTMIFDYEPDADRMTFYTSRGEKDMAQRVLNRYRAAHLVEGNGRLADESLDACRAALDGAARGQKQGVCEYRANLEGMGMRWYRAHWVRVADESGRVAHVVGRVEDIQGERALRRKAALDLMTALNNRATTQELVCQALRDDGRAACVFALLDVDNFKEINDTYGHARGDQLLRAVARLIKDRFRSQDIAGRVGGDEFALLLKGIPVGVAMDKLEDMLAKAQDLSRTLDIRRPVSLSVGVYAVAAEDRTFARVFDRADAALYAAKRAGKSRCVLYREGMDMGNG